MKEIEVKATVANPDRLMDKLAQMGCQFSAPLVQNDRVFFTQGKNPLNTGEGNIALRIREQNGRYVFNLKQRLSNEMDKKEHELEIKDPDEMAEILKMLGFEETVRINKQRRKTRYQGYEICLDEVEGFGTFIEVEKMTEDSDSLKIQAELFDFLLSLGIKESDRVLQGYDTLVFKRGQNMI